MKLDLAMAGAIAALCLTAPARAAPPAALEDPEARVVQELVVRGALPGPAWWRVERGGSVVYVLGLPDEPLPKGLAWDQSVLQRRLMASGQVIAPVRFTAGLGDIPALLRLRRELKSRQPLEETLPEPLKSRFAAARARLGRPASRYAGWDALFASQQIADDFYKSAETTREEPLAAIRKAAGRQRVPVRPAGTYKVMSLLEPAVSRQTPEIGQACLGDALDEVDRGAEGLRAAGAAWAKGDVSAVVTGPRGFARCLLLLSGGASFWRRNVEIEVQAISAALQRPGQAVAVLSLRSLVAEDGVLSQLKARGFSVSGQAVEAPGQR